MGNMAARRVGVASAAPAALAVMAIDGVEEVSLDETLEGSVASVDTEGKYSIARGENKKVRLHDSSLDSYHRANVLLLNPTFYQKPGTYRTSVVDGVRFTPDSDLKAGSFYFEGMELQFPAMVAKQEYELTLRTCRNLEAHVTKEEKTEADARSRQVTKTNYGVKLINNTGEEQTVEINIPVDAVTKIAGKFSPSFSYEEKTIAGEQYYVAQVKVGTKSTAEFEFRLEGR